MRGMGKSFTRDLHVYEEDPVLSFGHSGLLFCVCVPVFKTCTPCCFLLIVGKVVFCVISVVNFFVQGFLFSQTSIFSSLFVMNVWQSERIDRREGCLSEKLY